MNSSLHFRQIPEDFTVVKYPFTVVVLQYLLFHKVGSVHIVYITNRQSLGLFSSKKNPDIPFLIFYRLLIN